MGIPKTSNEDTDKISNAIVKKISADNDIDQTDRSHRVGLKKGRGCAPNHRKVHIILCQGRTHIEQKEAIATVSGDKLFPFLNWPLRPAGWSKDRPFVHRTFINDNLTKAGSRHQSTLSEESRQDQGCVVGWGDRISVCVKCNDKILSVTNIKDLSVFNA